MNPDLGITKLEHLVGKVILCTDGLERNLLEVTPEYVRYEIFSNFAGRWVSPGTAPRWQVEKSFLDGQEVVY